MCHLHDALRVLNCYKGGIPKTPSQSFKKVVNWEFKTTPRPLRVDQSGGISVTSEVNEKLKNIKTV